MESYIGGQGPPGINRLFLNEREVVGINLIKAVVGLGFSMLLWGPGLGVHRHLYVPRGYFAGTYTA